MLADVSPYTLVLATFLSQLVLYRLVSPLVVRQLYKIYNKPAQTNVQLNYCPASTAITLVENALSLYIFFCRPDVSPVRYEPSLVVRQLAGIWLGRIFADLTLQLTQPIFQRDVLLHHVVSVVTGCQAVRMGEMPWHMNLGIMMELSNPFINIRAAMLELGDKTSSAYVINGICFAGVFFLCRIATIPLYWYYTLPVILSGKIFEFEWMTVIGSLGCHTVFEVMSVYWFGKIIRIMVKFFRRGKSKEL